MEVLRNKLQNHQLELSYFYETDSLCHCTTQFCISVFNVRSRVAYIIIVQIFPWTSLQNCYSICLLADLLSKKNKTSISMSYLDIFILRIQFPKIRYSVESLKYFLRQKNDQIFEWPSSASGLFKRTSDYIGHNLLKNRFARKKLHFHFAKNSS